MADVSGDLRAARERAGLTIADVAAQTRIKPDYLEAIEAGEFGRLPGAFFTRAFLRTYARELHLSPAEVVAAYDATHHPAAPTSAADVAHDVLRPDPLLVHQGREWSRSPWTVAAAVVLVVAGLMLINRPRPAAPPEPVPTGTMGIGAPAAPPSPAAPVAPAAEGLGMEIRPTRLMWVTGFADGKRVIYRLLGPGERIRVDARQDLSFRVGDAAAFEFSLNGAPGKPLGRSGEVLEFQITRDNYRDYVR